MAAQQHCCGDMRQYGSMMAGVGLKCAAGKAAISVRFGFLGVSRQSIAQRGAFGPRMQQHGDPLLCCSRQAQHAMAARLGQLGDR